MSKPSVFFSGLLLPPLETFIRAPGKGLQQFTCYYLGSCLVKGLSLPSKPTLVINRGEFIDAAQEGLFKQL